LAEFLAYFNHDCRGFLRSDKTMQFGSLQLEPRTFRAIAFIVIFMILYPSLRWLAGAKFSWHADLSFTVAYLCFMEIIEYLIIYFNKDEKAKTTPKEPFPDLFSMKTRLVMIATVIVIAACASPFIWSNCFQKRMERNPEVYKEFLKKVPHSIKKQALWFSTH
jgi:hypothetical protein